MSDDSCPPADDAQPDALERTYDPIAQSYIGLPTQDDIMRFGTAPYWTGCFQADHVDLGEDGVSNEELTLIEVRTVVAGGVPARVILIMDRQRAAELGEYLIWMATDDDTPPPTSGKLIKKSPGGGGGDGEGL